MASSFFPQISSGALVQYPVRKTRHIRSILNSLADGSVIAAPDPYSGRLRWELFYQDLSPADRDLLINHFANCSGPFLPFTFIDPTDNMLNNSSNFQTASWLVGSTLLLQAGAPDPFGSNQAFFVSNNGQANEEISQTLNVPAYYQYCFSVYAASTAPLQIELIRRGQSQQTSTMTTTTAWTRYISSGKLAAETLTSFTIAISLAPGQQVSLFGPQLEAQTSPSRYRATANQGGVYGNAHFAANNLAVSGNSPSSFNTACIIETNA